MGAAWREIKDGKDFDHVIEMVKVVCQTGLEPCVTLGMLNEEQARRLKEAGLKAYNHNIDTSPEYYKDIITTRTFEDRLKTIEKVSKAGIDVCTGGIVGLGETQIDRVKFLEVLANLIPQPESVPINLLVPVKGTPLGEQPPLDNFELLRTIACARILMPKATVRLSAGRNQMSDEVQAMCFLAGANSIFTGEKLLTTPNPGKDHDHQLIEKLGMQIKPLLEAKTLTLA
jgi:biotin synthase